MISLGLDRWLLDTAAGVTVVLLAGWGLMRAVSQPAWRKMIGAWAFFSCFLVAGMAAMPSVPRWTLGLLPANVDQAVDLGVLRSDPHSGPANGSSAVASARARIVEPLASTALAGGVETWCVAVYVLAAAFMACRLACGLWLVRRLIRTGVEPPAEVRRYWKEILGVSRARLLVCENLPRPVATGFIRASVLIPSDLCDPSQRGELEAVLLHELAHVRGNDTTLLLLGSVLRTLLFVHPLYWLVWRDLRLSQEMLADAWAAQRIGSAAGYAERLVQMANASRPFVSWTLPVLQAIRRRSEFYQRMDFLLRSEGGIRLSLSRTTLIAVAVIMLLVGAAGAMITLRAPLAHSAPPPAAMTHAIGKAEHDGLAYLRSTQEKSGGWLSETGPGVTALVVRALLQAGDSPESSGIGRAMRFIEQTHQSDGGYYTSANPTYNTALVLSMLSTFPGDRYQQAIEQGREFLQSMQQPQRPRGKFYDPLPGGRTESEDRLRQLDALSEIPAARLNTGAASDHLTIQSPGDRADDAVLSANGTLTYIQLKSLLYAGLTQNDRRVTALINTIRSNFTLETNPLYGSPQGQYYFYYVASKALRAYGDPLILDGHGRSHDWRAELTACLSSQQAADGSWINPTSNYWLENNPILVTTYTVLALQEARQ